MAKAKRDRRELYAESRTKQDLMTISRQPKQFNLNSYWKKTLAVVCIGLMIYVGLLIGASLLTTIITGSLTNYILLDPVAAIVQTLLSGGVVYFCYRGIARLSRDLANSKKLRRKK